jgi:diguanylate cyclase (GGDEF)-like protein
MTSANSTGQPDSTLMPGADCDPAAGDPELQRLRRVGRQMFGVADCIVDLSGDATACAMEPASVEERFCRELARPGSIALVLDTFQHESLRRHRHVCGPPFIRFYATYPVYGRDKVPIGSVCLVDHAPRTGFTETERGLLADLAALVERELELRTLNASQLDLQKKNKNLRRRSLVDPLLGTWNRGAIMRILTIEAIRCDKAALPLSLIVVDLDYFKKINDTYGHPAGDAVLVKVASRLRSCIRPQEALGRYGGEEFLIVLPGSSHVTAMRVAERMRSAVAAQPEAVGGAMLNLSISAGVASTDMFPTATTEELISRADMALYVAKDGGRNRVVNATPDLS